MTWNRILSALVALVYLLRAYLLGGGYALMKTILFLILPMAAIWFSDAMGSILTSFPGPLSLQSITRQTPGAMVKIGGWFLLLSPVIAYFIIKVM